MDRTYCWQDLCNFVSYIQLNRHTFLSLFISITQCPFLKTSRTFDWNTNKSVFSRKEVWNMKYYTGIFWKMAGITRKVSNGRKRSNTKKNCLSCHGIQEWVCVQTNNGYLIILKQRTAELCVFSNWNCEVSLGQRSHAVCSCLHPDTRLIKKS